MAQEHINESILSEEILEDQKKNRIDHMTYLPGMEAIKSDVMDQVVAAAKAYDYDKYTAADVRRALAHDNRTPEDFAALSLLPLCHFSKRLRRQPRKRRANILETVYICSPQSISQTTVKTTAFTAVLTATTKSTVRS